ncbi:MAG TPA: prepilin-type N-terminal cleavage/methylation domain-containing protein [Planctomicrobium sp.]|nr:prepilin-type N-terminal cleavage/methylation domain-containing protein [Planctomicrobium sp.]
MIKSAVIFNRYSLKTSEKRHGWTLIEMSVVISLLSVIGVMTTRTISLLIQLGDTCVQEVTEGEIRFQLEQTVRRDVHQAIEIDNITTDPDHPVWLFAFPNEKFTVTYRISKDGLRREQRVNDTLQFSEFFVIQNHKLQISRDHDLVRMLFTVRNPDSGRAIMGPVEWDVVVRLAAGPKSMASSMYSGSVQEAL